MSSRFPNTQNPLTRATAALVEGFNQTVDGIGTLVDLVLPGVLPGRRPPLAEARMYDLKRESFGDSSGRSSPLSENLIAVVKNTGRTGEEKKSSRTVKPSEKPPIYRVGESVIEPKAAGWKKLNDENRALLQNPQGPMQQQLAPIAAEVLNSISTRNADYVNEAVSRVMKHPGAPHILRQLFVTMKRFDPIALGEQLEMRVFPITGFAGKAEPDSTGGGTSYTIRSHSGQVLTTNPYVIFDKKDPTTEPKTWGGWDLALSLSYTLWGKALEGAEQRRERMGAGVHGMRLEALVDIDFDELLKRPDLQDTAGQSPLLARNLQVYRELREEIERCQRELHNVTRGMGLHEPVVEALTLRSDEGGGLETWMRAQKHLPEALQLEFERWSTGEYARGSREERVALAMMLVYRASRSTIKLDIALGPLEEDLTALKELGEHHPEHPLFSPELVVDAISAIGEIRRLAGTGNEVRISALSECVENPLTRFRAEMNRMEFEPLKEEFELALQGFDDLFRENDRFKPEFEERSIRMDPLKRTLYGAEIGERSAEQPTNPPTRYPALSLADFRALREAMFYRHIAPTDDQFVRALSVSRFRDLVHGVIVAARKAAHIDRQYADWRAAQKKPADLPPAPGKSEHLCSDIDVAALRGFKPAVIKGAMFVPHEVFDREQPVTLSHLIRYKDYMESTRPQPSGKFAKPHPDWTPHLAQLKLCDAIGVFDQKLTDDLVPFIKQAAGYEDAAGLTEQVAKAQLIYDLPHFNTRLIEQYFGLNAPFLSHHTAEEVRITAKVADRAELVELTKVAVTTEQRETARFLRYTAKLMKGGVQPLERGKQRLQLSVGSLEDIAGPPHTLEIPVVDHTDKMRTVAWYTPAEIAAAKTALETNYVALNQLAAVEPDSEIIGMVGSSAGPAPYAQKWAEKVRFLCNRKAERELHSQGFETVDSETFRAVGSAFYRLTPDKIKTTYVSRDFVRAVAAMRMNPDADFMKALTSKSMNPAAPLPSAAADSAASAIHEPSDAPHEIVKGGFIRWKDQKAVFGSGNKQDRTLGEVLFSAQSSYITDYCRTKDSRPRVNRVGAIATRLHKEVAASMKGRPLRDRIAELDSRIAKALAQELPRQAE